jgi:SNF2 family DNA or RNA helicase
MNWEVLHRQHRPIPSVCLKRPAMASSIDHAWWQWRRYFVRRAALADELRTKGRSWGAPWAAACLEAEELATLHASMLEIEYTPGDAREPRLGTKLDAILAYLQQLWARDPTICVVLASGLRPVLHLLQGVLEAELDVTVVLFGGNNVASKSRVLAELEKPATPVRVVLLDTSHASSGTNLVRASHVILVDPVTGTSAGAHRTLEQQVIGRVHRQNQHRPVTVTRFVVRGTPEYACARRLGMLAGTPDETGPVEESGSMDLSE